MARRQRGQTPGPGHNSAGAGQESETPDENPLTKTEFARLLKDSVDQIESLLAERKQVNDLIADVYTMAKSHGLDTKAIRKIISIRAADKSRGRDAREAEEATILNYMNSLGMLG